MNTGYRTRWLVALIAVAMVTVVLSGLVFYLRDIGANPVALFCDEAEIGLESYRLLHGNADTDVPYEQSVMMAAELKKHGVPHDFITLANGEHGFDGANPAEIEAAYQAAIAFTKKYLGMK